MIIGLSVSAFTTLHVIISLVPLAAGFVVMYGMVAGRRLPGWSAAFLATIVLTSVTGFMFPLTVIGPPHVFGAVSLVVLGLAIYALYARRLAGYLRALALRRFHSQPPVLLQTGA